jgi:hypothetical protein
LLAVAIALTVGGFLSLAITTNDALTPAPRLVSPTFGTTSPYTTGLFGGTTTTDRRVRRATTSTWATGGHADVGRGHTSGPTTSGPQSEPPTQVDVAVPAAGAQVSVGRGDGSCTEVAITALTPDKCPSPQGDGPVVVNPGPSSGPLLGSPKSADLAA